MILKTFSKWTDFTGYFMHFSTLTSVYLSSFSIDFSMETITSVPVVYSTHVDRRQECREESIAEVLQSEDAVLINDLDD